MRYGMDSGKTLSSVSVNFWKLYQITTTSFYSIIRDNGVKIFDYI